MAGLTRTDYVDMLEEIYFLPGRQLDLIYRDNPLLAILERSKNKGGGRYIHVPVTYTRPQGRSATFATAQSNATSSNIDAFQVTYVSNYGVGTVDGDVIDDADENMELVAEALQFEVDGAISNLRDDLAHNAFRNLGGARGVVSSISTVDVVLTNPEDVVHFEVGQEIVGDTTDGTSGTVHTGSATLTAVDRDAYTLTTDSNWTAQISSLAQNDYLFVEGDFGNKMSGLEGWIPSAAPGATAYFGVDRSVDTRLGGLRSTETGKPIEEAIMTAAAKATRWGGKPDIGFMEPMNWNSLAISLSNSGRGLRIGTVRGSGDAAKFGFDAIMVATSVGDIPIVADPNAQPDVVWLLQQDSWKIRYSGKDLVRIVDDDGTPYMREASNDGVEFRVKSRGNVCCYAPGKNIRASITGA